MVTASASKTVMLPLAVMDKVSVSTVFRPTDPDAAEPSVTAPIAADKTKLVELFMLPMVMLPVLEMMLTLPAKPAISVITMSPSATIEMLPPSTMVMEETLSAPACDTVRSPLAVMVTFMLLTLEVKLRSPPTLTVKDSAVTLPPKVTPPEAANCTIPPPMVRPTLMSETTTKSPWCVASPAPKLINSFTPAWVGKLTTVRLPVVFNPKLPVGRSGITNT